MTTMLDLAPAAVLVLDGTEWTVERAEPQFGRVDLVATTGERTQVSIRFLIHHPDCRQSTRTDSTLPAGRSRHGLPSLSECC